MPDWCLRKAPGGTRRQDKPMPKKRVTLVHNPLAGDDRQPTAGQLNALIEEAGFKVRYQSTKDAGWEKVLAQPADIIAVAGGDGTIARVAKGLVNSGVPITVLPLGTANNISKTLGISDLYITELIRSWKTSDRRSVDVGTALGPWGKRNFIEGFGAGLLANLMGKAESSETLENLMDAEPKVIYAQELFRDHLATSKAVDIEATLDGQDISGHCLMFEVLNMQFVGPNLFLAPNAANGEFEVVCVTEKHRSSLQKHVRYWQEGKLRQHAFKTYRGKSLRLQWTGFKVHIDDKIWPDGGMKTSKAKSEIQLEIQPGALQFLVPSKVRDLEKSASKQKAKGKKGGKQ